MKTNDSIEVTLDSIRGDGCSYTDDGRHAVFGALPGEKVIGVPVARKRKRLYLRSVEVITPASQRVEPQCTVASFCGGCSFQHASKAFQLECKLTQVRLALGATVPQEWLSPIFSNSYAYRTKARLGVKYVDKKERVLIGFREKMKPYITDTECCPVLVDPVSNLIQPLISLISGLSDPKSIPQIEVACGDTEVALIFRHLTAVPAADLRKLRLFGREKSVQMFLQPRGIDSTHKVFPQDDQELLEYRLPDYDLLFKFSPQDFTQVNLAVNRLMVGKALELLDLESSDHVLDAFCGIGNFSLPISRFVRRVTGAEQSLGSVLRARDNARLNEVKNVSFFVQNLYVDNPEIDILKDNDKALLDPPRSGAEALVRKLAISEIDRIVYISCNPETLARDIKVLEEGGYKLQSAGIIDMFPHTTHVESIALLVR